MNLPARKIVHFEDNGGTMSGHEEYVLPVTEKGRKPPKKGFTQVVPKRGKILQLLQHEVPNAGSYSISYEVSEYFRDSAFYTHEDIMGIVASVRKTLSKYPDADLIIPGGTDTFSQVMMGIAQGVSPEELKDRCILGVAAQKHASPNRPEEHIGHFYNPDHCEPVKNLSNALYLATRNSCRGRILLLCGNLLLPARGFEKIDARGPQPFFSRLTATSASPDCTLPLPDWPMDEVRWMELPTGKNDETYSLAGGVECISLSPNSDYVNVRNMIWGALNCDVYEDEMPGKLRGVVMAVPGDKNFRKDPRGFDAIVSMVNMCEEKGIPVGVVAQPMYRQQNHQHVSKTQYEGNVSNLTQKCSLIDFSEATRTEAEMLISQFMAEAIHLKLRKKGRLQHVKKRLQEYTEHMNRNDGYVPS